MRLGDLDALEQFFLHESKRLREFMNSEGCDQEERKYINTFLPTVEWARKTVHGISTIDAVPVVRCKDCKHTGTDGLGAIYCEKWDRWEMPEDFFCYYGKRKDGDGK